MHSICLHVLQRFHRYFPNILQAISSKGIYFHILADIYANEQVDFEKNPKTCKVEPIFYFLLKSYCVPSNRCQK